jgi:hypothetical protein
MGISKMGSSLITIVTLAVMARLAHSQFTMISADALDGVCEIDDK